MVQSYTTNPKFGDAKKFQSELDSAIHHIQVLESDLHALNSQLKDVIDQLKEKKGNSPQPSVSTHLTIPMAEKSSAGSGSKFLQSDSAGYGTISNYSSSDRGSEGFDNKEVKISLHDDFRDESLAIVVAMYSYNGDCSESSIAMEAGEEFIVTEGDEGGWTKVRRKEGDSEDCEGFVPTAYLQCI
jgi:hypothetical protein